LARMLAGLPDSDLGIAHAEELLAVADREKRG
jgi:DNA repair protein RecN (Recombination protein N)